jgi:ligand-binding sensor domain-containing protein
MNRFDKPIIRVMKCERRTGPTFGLACFLLSLFSILPARALNPDKQISQYAHSVWKTKDGVFAGELRRVAQTTNGYLWIGTTAGLWRFDGIRFVEWVSPDGQQLLSSRINSSLATPDGSLWIGTALGLSRWKDGYLTNFANDKGVVPAIVQARDGTIWILKAASVGDLGPSSSHFYWEDNNNNFSAGAQKTNQIKVPVAITVFPHEIYRAPESWSRQAYPSLYYFHEAPKGGHFAAWEQPQLFPKSSAQPFTHCAIWQGPPARTLRLLACETTPGNINDLI